MFVDGTVAFCLDTTGVRQIWTLQSPGEWPQQLTFGDNPVSFAASSPTRHELVFGRDQVGDEHTQLYRRQLSGTTTPLTECPESIHRWGGWSNDGEKFAFAANRRDPSQFDIYVQERTATGDSAEQVFEGDGYLAVNGWSPDDSKLLLTDVHGSSDQDIYVLSLANGERTHLTPHDGKVRYRSVQWAPDSDGLYLVTDEGAETLYLARLDLNGTLRSLVDGGEWNVEGVAVDTETGRFVYSRNVEGYNELSVCELTGPTDFKRFPDPDPPGGLAGGISWGPAAEQFAVTVSGRTLNTNVFVVDVVTGESERWTHAATAGIPESSFVAPELIHYDSFDGLTVPAFLSLPAETTTGATPVVVDIHGGPASQRRPSFSGLTQYLLAEGYAVFEPNIRGSTGYGAEYAALDDVENRMDSVRDVRAGVKWLSDHPAVDPDRISAMGGSYGGFVVLAALTEYPELWAAGVDIAGIANFVTFLENTMSHRQDHRATEYGSLENDREFLESISPVNSIDTIAAPLFVLHGENDPRVPLEEAEQVVAGAREQDVPVEFLTFPDEGHGIESLENRSEAYTRIVDFLNEHV